MSTLFREWLYVLRLLVKSPVVSLLTILVFATGFGLAVYMYALLKMFAYADLPFPNSDRIVTVDAVINGVNQENGLIPLHDYRYFAAHQKSFETFFPGRSEGVLLTAGSTAMRARGNYSGSAMFSLTGVNPQYGRAFGPADEQSGAPPVAILSHQLWQQFYGGDPGIIGRTVKISDVPTTIVGIMPVGFRFPISTEVWLPFSDPGVVQPGDKPQVHIYGLLKPGISLAEANRDLQGHAGLLAQNYPQTNKGLSVKAWPFTQANMEGALGLVAVMASATAFILLLVCVNVVNLLIARAGERQKELAIRAALGAPRHRLIRQMLLESMSLALAGGLVGLFCAAWAMEWAGIQFNSLGETIPFWWTFSITWETLLFAGVLVVGLGLAIGILPAWRASGGDLAGFLRDGTRGALGRRVAGFTRAMVGVETLLCTALLIGSGVLVLHMYETENADFGGQTKDVLRGRVSLDQSITYKDSDEAVLRLAQTVKRELESDLDPRTEAAIVATILPAQSGPVSPALSEDMDAADKELPRIMTVSALPGYFEGLNIRLLEGRSLQSTDSASSAPVAVINESLARQFWPNTSALGKRVKLDPQVPGSPWVTVVGVSEQIVHGEPSAKNREKPVIYLPLSQRIERELTFAVRSPRGLSADVLVSAVARADAGVPVWGVEPLESVIKRKNGGTRFISWMFVVFALLGLLLAGSGIYAITSRSVQLRTHEIGVRRALGANERHVFTLLFKESGKQLAIGSTIGLLMGAAMIKLLSEVIYDFRSDAPILFLLVVMLLTAVVGVATLIPALRAIRVSPNVALHYE
jgi:predicted permease